jgi:hypothetical protein
MNRKPVKFAQCGSNVMMTFDGWYDHTCQCILNALKSVYGTVRESVVERVTVI